MSGKEVYRVLVPLDGSSLAESALPVARQLLHHSRDELLLLRVAPLNDVPAPVMAEYAMVWPTYQEGTATLEQEREEASTYLSAVQARPSLADLHTRTLVTDGDRSQSIIDTAIEEDVDLIVITSHGRTGLSRWVMGSVAERVLQSSPCPVLLWRNASGDASLPERILVTLDGSPMSETVLEPVLELALRLDAGVHLLRVVPESDEQLPQPDPYLASLIERFAGEGVELTTETIAAHGAGAANIALTIIDYADKHEMGLIAMSTHGRSGLQRWVFGSVTEKVLRGTDKALFVVRPPRAT